MHKDPFSPTNSVGGKMSFRSIVRELRDGFGSISRRGGSGSDERGSRSRRNARSGAAVAAAAAAEEERGNWEELPPELLLDIIQRVEASEAAWPARRNVVACASVCRNWRESTKEVAETPEQCGRITFPISLKQPGPRDSPIQCFIRRDRATSTYKLYLGLSPSLQGENDKLLLAARKIRRATSTDFIVSLSSSDFSRASSTYIGKLRSNFLGTKFTVFDSEPPHDVAHVANNRSSRRIHSKQVSPRVPAGNYEIATVAYELNVLRARGPRRMRCTLHSVPISSIQEGGSAPTLTGFIHSLDQFSLSTSKGEELLVRASAKPLVLKNKAPRWHEQLQCWCLNFRGRVTVASVKNFQLVADVDASHGVSSAEQERVILQFGKIGKDIFTMDFRYPLSAFQAFAICLSSFDTKPACE